MDTAKVNVELRICDKERGPVWGFAAGDMFYPFGSSGKDKALATLGAQHFRDTKYAEEYVGIPLSMCSPNLDTEN